MAGFTLDELKARLDLYLEAEKKALRHQEFWVEGRRTTYADLRTIQRTIADLNAQIKRLTPRTTPRVLYQRSR